MSKEAMKLALKRAFQFGQDYWYQADHESYRQNKKSEETLAQFRQFVDETCEALAEQPEFIKHEVENADDWSEWVCPDPKGYLIKCCDCGLVHEAEFGVVRYQSETEREDCDMVDDQNLQAVFRMRRSEQWSLKDTAHRAGGMPMAEQPAQQQEPVFWYRPCSNGMYEGPIHNAQIERVRKESGAWHPLYTYPLAQRKPLTDEVVADLWSWSQSKQAESTARTQQHAFARAIEAAHGIKGDA